MKKALLFFAVLFFINANAQFTEISSQFGILLTGNTVQSGCGASFYDFDHDGWDDLTLAEPFNPILAYHNNNGMYEIAAVFDNNGDAKAVQWVDFDNDGDPDFFFSVLNQGCKLYRNEGNLVFTNISDSLDLPITTGRSFGCSWGDYDNDSFLDVYICNYSTGSMGHTNWLLHNNGNGGFENVTDAMGVGNGIRPSYQSAWTDVNFDGLLDLYVVNDFDWVNELYINNGVTFDAAGSSYGLDVAMEGMSNSWSDFDSDGDFDVFVSNNFEGNVLMKNDGGVFTDIGLLAGVQVNSTCWGSLWMDYDHDGNDDLHVSTSAVNVNGNQNVLFHNNGDYTFSDVSMPGDAQIVFASAKGDQNNDGWWDFVEMKQYPAAIALWQNNGGANHWLKFGLTGTVSNREGIGAIVRYYYPGKAGILQTHSGEGYLDQDSQYEIISMAQNTLLDSLSIQWPSGWIDRHYNLTADAFYAFVEGETFEVVITSEEGNFICPSNGSLELMASEGAQYLWNDGDTTQQNVVSAAGNYSVIVFHESGVQAEAQFEVLSHELAIISAETEQPSCYGFEDGCIHLSAASGSIESVLWNSVPGTPDLCAIPAGMYVVKVTDQNGCDQVIEFELTQPEEMWLIAFGDTTCFGQTISAYAQGFGGSGSYTFDFDGFDPDILPAGEYIVTASDQNNCTASTTLVVPSFPELIFTMSGDTICDGETAALIYSAAGGTPDYFFDWAGNDPMHLSAGTYTFSIMDASLCSITQSVEILESPPMTLSATIANAENGNNGSISIDVTGGTEPIAFAWNDMEGSNVLSDIGQGTYGLVVTDAAGCVATDSFDIIDIQVSEIETDLKLFPNPCNQSITIVVASPGIFTIADVTGKIVATEMIYVPGKTIDVSQLPEGIYNITSSNSRAVIVVQH